MSTKQIFSHFSKLVILIPLMLLVVLSGCKKDEDDNETADKPTLPPQKTFAMDYSEFTGQTGGIIEGSLSAEDVQGSLNRAAAGVYVGVWNLVLTGTLALPVASYAEAFNHEAIYEGDGTWVWRYNFWGNYQAELYGKLLSVTQVQWKMYITVPNATERFLWYEGQGDFGQTAGSWTLYESPEKPNQFLTIEWHKNELNQTFDTKYTLVKEDDEAKGSYIEYGVTTDADYNAYYSIYDSKKNENVAIKWNSETHAGKIQVKGTWLCWEQGSDMLFYDVACGAE